MFCQRAYNYGNATFKGILKFRVKSTHCLVMLKYPNAPYIIYHRMRRNRFCVKILVCDKESDHAIQCFGVLSPNKYNVSRMHV